jgi:lipoyl(octanoyl) transferase
MVQHVIDVDSLLLEGRAENDVTESCWVLDLDRLSYTRSMTVQSDIVRRRKHNEIPDCLLFVDYFHTITLGRSGKLDHLLVSESELEGKGIEFFLVDRGGDITYHGPGQFIAYPVIDLKKWRRDIGLYLRNLESCIIATLEDFGIIAGRTSGATGVWVGTEKIAAIGVRASQWVTSHGVALNVNTELNYFDFIVPCGLHFGKVTSMSKILGFQADMAEVKRSFCHHFGKNFGRTLRKTRYPSLS